MGQFAASNTCNQLPNLDKLFGAQIAQTSQKSFVRPDSSDQIGGGRLARLNGQLVDRCAHQLLDGEQLTKMLAVAQTVQAVQIVQAVQFGRLALTVHQTFFFVRNFEIL